MQADGRTLSGQEINVEVGVDLNGNKIEKGKNKIEE